MRILSQFIVGLAIIAINSISSVGHTQQFDRANPTRPMLRNNTYPIVQPNRQPVEFLEALFGAFGSQPRSNHHREIAYSTDDFFRNSTNSRSNSSARPLGRQLSSKFLPQTVSYNGSEKPGTIVIDTSERLLYLVQDDHQAKRYGIGVGRDGFSWAGIAEVTAKREWPEWIPPQEMRARRPELPRRMSGGSKNPLGARALYLSSTLYRIHGSNEPWTIGTAVSSGCFRMRNEDVIDLYRRVKIGTKVVVM